MFVAIRDKNNSYIGVSASDTLQNIGQRDLALEDNVPVWKIAGRKGWYMVCNKTLPTTDAVRYAKNLLDKQITGETLVRYTVTKIKECLEKRELVKERNWYTCAAIVRKDKIYSIDSSLLVHEEKGFCVRGEEETVVRGSLEFNRGLPARQSIREAFQTVTLARNKQYFPVTVIDTATGKREIWWSYEDALKKTKGKDNNGVNRKKSTADKMRI